MTLVLEFDLEKRCLHKTQITTALVIVEVNYSTLGVMSSNLIGEFQYMAFSITCVVSAYRATKT